MADELDLKTRDLCVDILRELANQLKKDQLTYKEVAAQLRRRADWITDLYEIKQFIEVEKNGQEGRTSGEAGDSGPGGPVQET